MKKILIVEDTKSICEEISTMLNFENYEVIEANDGKQGLKMAMTEIPDLIISDILMPELDGYSLRTELSKNNNTANIPFIFITAKASKEEITKGLSLGVPDYLIKPFMPEDLINKVRKLLI